MSPITILGCADEYKEQHLDECLIGRHRYFRRVFTHSDKYARRFLAFIHLACTFVWLR